MTDINAENARLPGLGHNNGPTMEPGARWRAHCWGKARKDLLPRLPVEVVRRRLKRAREIGLDYSTYATVQASTGRDIVAILFSTNALRLLREGQALDALRVARLAAINGCERRALAIAPLTADAVFAGITVRHGPVLEAAVTAPDWHANWPETVRALNGARPARVPSDAVLLIGDTAIERGWTAAGRFAGYLEADRYFASPPA